MDRTYLTDVLGVPSNSILSFCLKTTPTHPGNSDGFLKRTGVEKNGFGINPYVVFRTSKPPSKGPVKLACWVKNTLLYPFRHPFVGG